MEWLTKQNEICRKLEKLQTYDKGMEWPRMLVRKDRENTTGQNISLQDHTIKSEETVKLLGVTLDNKLNFDTHISNLCKKAATQLNVLKRLRSFIGFEQKKVLVQSFVYSNFNYCPLVCIFLL